MGILSRKKKMKVSEMLLDVAHGYVSMGDDLEEKQSLLRSASSAWNIACLEEGARKKALKKYLKAFKKANPHATKRDMKDIEQDIKQLIEQKLELYPDEKIQIFEAMLEMKDGKENVIVVSMRTK